MMLIVRKTKSRLVIQKPFFKDPKWLQRSHFGGSERIEAKNYIIINKDVVMIGCCSFRSIKEQ